jgi:hypothetical protein
VLKALLPAKVEQVGTLASSLLHVLLLQIRGCTAYVLGHLWMIWICGCFWIHVHCVKLDVYPPKLELFKPQTYMAVILQECL